MKVRWIWGMCAAGLAVSACGGSDPVVIGNGNTNGDDAAATAGDGGDADSGSNGGGSDGGTTTTTSSDGGNSSAGDAGATDGFEVSPAGELTLVVQAGEPLPTLTFTATNHGDPVTPGWNVDRGELGRIEPGPDGTAVLTPTGTAGGRVVVRAGFGGEVIERDVWIEIVASQNGADTDSPAQVRQIPDSVPDLTASGGVGGVGGEGLGPAVDDDTESLFEADPVSDGSAQSLRWLYPYDGTVWPRGMLAPLLMWESDLGSVDAVHIALRTTGDGYTWSGTFAAPAILGDTGGPFIRHPIPQDVWETATNTAGSISRDGGAERLEVSLTLAKDGVTYGPLTQTWTIAPARLSGTIYYASYGTNLAKNFNNAVGGDGRFGGAVLSIKVGDTGPQLVAGSDGNSSNCRVCHSVSADGSRLTAVNGSEGTGLSAAYDIDNVGITESTLAYTLSYPALTTDGRYALAENALLRDMDAAGTPVVATSGLSDVTSDVGTPTFSYDTTKVAFNPTSGPIANPTRKLVVMDFDVDTLTFSNPFTVVDNTGDPNPETRPGWPSFTPDGNLLFHQQVEYGNDGGANNGDLRTRRGAKAYIAWTRPDAERPVALNALNGLDENGDSYLPPLAAPITMTCTADGFQVGGIDTSHEDDANLNYEPTVNPVASGGYAWVVFTSRRRYGSFATIPPFCSDPRGVDLIENVTTKKLWVAAIDLEANGGDVQGGVDRGDISHPAFYLPAQEMLAGNTRGSWVLDPCRPDGESCETGDMCCNGYCSADDDGALICKNEPPEGQCSALQERCESDGDCCDPAHACLNNFCSYVLLE